MKKAILLFCIFEILFRLSAQEFTNVDTEKVRKIGYVTHARVAYEAGHTAVIRQVLTDLAGYNDWALKGLDGKDEFSSTFIGILDALEYNASTHEMNMRYTVNLPRPFASRGSILMKTFVYESVDAVTVEFNMEDANSAISKALVRFTIIDKGGDKAELQVYGAVRLRWYFDIFLSEKKYKEAVEWKILKIASNLLACGGMIAAESSAAVDKSPKL
ncbi:MAG: hypothetical protein JW874_03935 [Spirochaetales bacterium]|nr:hypothetical protein [Spirochaetales bacterium]